VFINSYCRQENCPRLVNEPSIERVDAGKCGSLRAPEAWYVGRISQPLSSVPHEQSKQETWQ
jgi:hypothetical protein